MQSHANFECVRDETSNGQLVIRDLGPWNRHPTITNDAEFVVKNLYDRHWLASGRVLLYYDSEGEVAEILHHNGRFLGFAPVNAGKAGAA